MAGIRGSAEFKARMKAAKLSFKDGGAAWADATADAMRPMIPHRTGKARSSVKRRNATQKRATVYAIWYARILDTGAKAHDIEPRRKPSLVFQASGRTIFAKKVHKPQQRGLDFAIKAVREGYRREPLSASIIEAWNAAA